MGFCGGLWHWSQFFTSPWIFIFCFWLEMLLKKDGLHFPLLDYVWMRGRQQCADSEPGPQEVSYFHLCSCSLATPYEGLVQASPQICRGDKRCMEHSHPPSLVQATSPDCSWPATGVSSANIIRADSRAQTGPARSGITHDMLSHLTVNSALLWQ